MIYLGTPMQDPVILGKFGGTHGVHGWIKVYSYTQPAENIKKYQHWFVKYKNQWQPIIIEGCKIQSTHLIVKVKDIHSPEEVHRYTNCLIGVESETLPELPPGEYYWSELTGLTVVTLTGKLLGKIAYLFETGANDVIVVKDSEKHEHLLPYIPDVVKSVDLKKAEMLVDWEVLLDEPNNDA